MSCSTITKADGPKTVTELDLIKYQGTWNQMAAIPAVFQRDCTSNTTAEYKLLDSGLIKVVNSCEKENGKRKSSEARARINPDYNDPGKLEVTFVKIFGWIWSFAGDYWVMYINTDYNVALIGNPGYDYGWILSKKESLTKEEYRDLNQMLITNGYDSCQFILSNTPQQRFDSNIRLCDYVRK